MKRLYFALAICLSGLIEPLFSQSASIIDLKTRHRFAQSAFGLFADYQPAFESPLSGGVEGASGFRFQPQSTTFLSISGMHFWGKVDFYIHIPTVVFSGADRNYSYRTGVDTGVKYFFGKGPFKSAVSPFVGVSFTSLNFRYLGPTDSGTDDGAEYSRFRYPIHFGIAAIARDRHYFELSGSWFPNNKADYYFERSQVSALKLPPFRIRIGYRFLFDTTVSAEEDYLSGKTRMVEEKLGKAGKLNTFTVGIGISSAFFLRNQSDANRQSPYLDKPLSADIFPEFGLGFYHNRLDAQVNLAYRRICSTIGAFGHTQDYRREALSLDIYKFLFDFNGFVPFAGLSPSWEKLSVTDVDQVEGTGFRLEDRKLKMGFVFGWDIRPNRLQFFTLRTNLRYYPGLYLEKGGANPGKFNFDQLEFNFIQAVFNLNRIF